jgi:hypothetical protein
MGTLRHAPPVRHPLLYRGPIVRGRPRVFSLVSRRYGGVRRVRGALSATLGVLLAALLASGCGGGARQDSHEPAGAFTMQVVHASFPVSQSIARPARLELQVRNTGPRTAPNVAVTLDSFYYTENYPELAVNKRPVWVIERGPGAIAKPPVESQVVSPPGGGQTAYVNTWALGPLAPGSTRTFLWRVTPVKAGLHTVHFTVAAGLAGKAKAELASGGPVQGQLTASIAPAPPAMHVDPSTGQIVSGAYPLIP